MHRAELKACNGAQSEVFKLFSELHTQSSLSKHTVVAEYVSELIGNGSKLLLFAHHIAMLDVLVAAAEKAKVLYPCLRLVGEGLSASGGVHQDRWSDTSSC